MPMRPVLHGGSVQCSGIVKEFWRQEFQTHSAMEPRVFGFVDDTHTTTTELFDDAVMRDGLAEERIGNCHVRSC